MIPVHNRMFLQIQRHHENMVLSNECVITRTTSEGQVDPGTGVFSRDKETIYSGPCLVRPALRDYRPVQFGGQEVIVNKYDIRLPQNTNCSKDDIIEVTKAEDSSLIGRQFIIRDVQFDEWQTVRKVIAEEAN